MTLVQSAGQHWPFLQEAGPSDPRLRLLSNRPFMPNLVPPKIPGGERVDFDVSGGCGTAGLGWGWSPGPPIRGGLMTYGLGGCSEMLSGTGQVGMILVSDHSCPSRRPHTLRRTVCASLSLPWARGHGYL